jgi:hypothetical protein
MLNLKLLAIIVALLISLAAAYRTWTHEGARSETIKQSIRVAPNTAAAVTSFKDR